jgi:hypothetical protein
MRETHEAHRGPPQARRRWAAHSAADRLADAASVAAPLRHPHGTLRSQRPTGRSPPATPWQWSRPPTAQPWPFCLFPNPTARP